MADLVDQLVKDLQHRANEIAPLVDEHRRLSAAIEALSREGLIAVRRPAALTAGLQQGGKAHHRVLRAVARTPGMDAGELVRRLGFSPGYVSSLTSDLRRWDSVVRVGKAFYLPADAPASAGR